MLWKIQKGGGRMSREECVMHYKAAIAVFKQWLEEGYITAEEFAIISTNTAEKYEISSTSIYRDMG
jgi:hypothetical protein